MMRQWVPVLNWGWCPFFFMVIIGYFWYGLMLNPIKRSGGRLTPPLKEHPNFLVFLRIPIIRVWFSQSHPRLNGPVPLQHKPFHCIVRRDLFEY